MFEPSQHARDIQSSVLPNGVRVISEQMPAVRSVSIGIWIDAGSRREVGSENGITHFIEHMVFKGTGRRSAETIAREMDELGGNLDAFTGKELVSYNTKVLDEHLPRAFDVLGDMVLNPSFREEDINKERGVILEELKMEVDNPEYLVHETFASNFWKDHPLGRPILGTRETIRGFTRQMIGSFYESVYSPRNILITAAGNVRHELLHGLAGDYFAGLRSSPRDAHLEAPKTHARLTLRHKKELEQVHLLVGVPAFPVADERRFSAYVLNTLLGGSMSSRLFQNIREQRGLVYSVFSELHAYRDTGCLAIYAGTSAATLRQVLLLILEEMRAFKENMVSAEELQRAKSHLKGSLMLGLESTSSRMTNLARQALYFGRFYSLDEILASIEEVTPEGVRDVACRLFDRRHIALTALGKLNGLRLKREELVC